MLNYKNMLSILLIALILSIIIFPNIIYNYNAYAATITTTIYDLGYIDCWTNSEGEWIKAKDHNGNDILPIPKYAGGGSVSYTFKLPVPSEFIGKITDVKKVEYDDSSSKWNAAIKEEHVNIKSSYSFGDNYVMFSVTLDYLESNRFEGKGENIKEDWQAPLVQGRRFYLPTKITFEYIEENLDTVTAIYKDINGNIIKSSDKYSPSKEGYFTVNAANINGYKLVSPSSGKYDVWIGNNGINHEVIFTYEVIDDEEPSPEGDIWIRIDVPDQVEKGKTFSIIQNHESTYPVVQIEWFENGEHKSKYDGMFEGYTRSITRGRTFGVRITDIHGNTAYDEKYVDAVEEIPDFINAVLEFDNVYPSEIELTYEDIVNDTEFEVIAWLTGEKTTTNSGYPKHYWYWVDKIAEELPPRGEEDSADYYETISRKEYEETPYYSSVRATFKVRPSDPVMKASLRVVNSTVNNRLYGEDTAYYNFNFIMPETEPPQTKLTLPETFYPFEVTSSSDIKNTITWSYESVEEIPYKHSEVSLYKIIDNVLYPVFENKIQLERKLNVEGYADEEYYIKVKVVDILNKKSLTEDAEFKYINVRPEIAISLDESKINENLLGINIENNTPSQIESQFPTEYTYWEIKNTNGETLNEGQGKAPLWVNIDERYYGNVSTVIQYAKNILGNETHAQAKHINNSLIDFRIVPARLFETEFAKIENRTKAIEDSKWSIRKTLDKDYTSLSLNKNMEFTKEYGHYQVKLEGKGRVVDYKNLYQYSNNENELKEAPTEPTVKELNEIYGEKEIEYVYKSTIWDDDIEHGEFEHEGNTYLYRRKKLFMVMKTEEMSTTNNIEFISIKPSADFVITGYKKQYKKLTLDGSVSKHATNTELESKYPIDFTHPLTQFQIIPIKDRDDEVDHSKNQYIQGIGKEEINNIITFKGKELQDVRIDNTGWYRIRYKVYNGKKESSWKEQEVYISEELIVTVDIDVENTIVYRNPDDSLKARLDINVTYNSPDDTIDKDRSRLYLEYREDGNFSSEINKTYWIGNSDANIPSFVKIGTRQYLDNQAKFTLYIDNPTKNLLGYFRFNFEAIEKPLIPNFNDSSFPEIPTITGNTFDIDDNKKIILIDNHKPIVNLETKKESIVEVWIIEESGRPIDVEAILQELNLKRIKATIYVIQDNNVTIYEN